MHDGGRPAGAPPAKVTVRLQRRCLGTIDVRPGFQDVPTRRSRPISSRQAAGATDPAQLTLVSTVWVPRDFLGGTDDRRPRASWSIGSKCTDGMSAACRSTSRASARWSAPPTSRSRPLGWVSSRGDARGRPVRRVLLLRLERIGDLLMVARRDRATRARRGRTPRSISPSAAGTRRSRG